MRMKIVLLFSFVLACSVSGKEDRELALGVNINGAPTVGFVSKNTSGNPPMIMSKPLISFQYYYKVKSWKWQAVNSQEDAKKGWTTKRPVIEEQNAENYVYTGRVGSFPYTMKLCRKDGNTVGIDYDISLKCAPDESEEKLKLRESSERGVLIKVYDKAFLQKLKLGETGSKNIASFAVDGKDFSLILNSPYTIKGVSRPSPGKRLKGKETWICVDLGIGDPDSFSFSFELKSTSPLNAYLDYRAFACKNDQSKWFGIPLNDSSCYLDISQSILDAPAGKYGFLTARDGKFYFQKKKEPVFFSGTTFVHSSKFPEKKNAEVFSRRVAALGFNLVRLHHLDYHISGFGIWDRKEMSKDKKTGSLDSELMDRMDYFIYCLKKEGVYIHLDGITARTFMENDGIEDYDKLTFGLKGSAYVFENKAIIKKQKEFFRKLWEHHNPYTRLSYKDDPAIVSTAIINENDLYTHGSLNHHFPKSVKKDFMAMWNKWADKKNFQKDYPVKFSNKNALAMFKRDTMRSYFDSMRGFLHEMNSVRPVCGTTWMYKSAMLPLLSSCENMDFTADHPYTKNMLDSDEMNLFKKGRRHFSYMNFGKRFDKPFVHEEWTAKGFDRTASTALPMALMTALDHDMSIQFAMYHAYDGGPRKDVLSLNMAFDPARVFMFPALNLMFIRRDLKPNPDQYVYMLTEDVMFGLGKITLFREDIKAIYPSYDLATFYGRASFAFSKEDVKEIKKKNPDAQIIYPGVKPKKLPDENQYPIVSGSGEIELYWKDRYFLAKGKRSKLAMGFLGGSGAKELGDGVTLEISEPEYVCAAVSSLSDKNITESKHLMITIVGSVELKDMFYDSKWKNPIAPSHSVVAQPVKGSIRIPVQIEDPVVYARNSGNGISVKVDAEKKNGVLIVPLRENTLVYEIKDNQSK